MSPTRIGAYVIDAGKRDVTRILGSSSYPKSTAASGTLLIVSSIQGVWVSPQAYMTSGQSLTSKFVDTRSGTREGYRSQNNANSILIANIAKLVDEETHAVTVSATSSCMIVHIT